MSYTRLCKANGCTSELEYDPGHPHQQYCSAVCYQRDKQNRISRKPSKQVMEGNWLQLNQGPCGCGTTGWLYAPESKQDMVLCGGCVRKQITSYKIRTMAMFNFGR